MDNLKVGHFTDTENGTGLSVFLFNRPAVGAYVLCGSSPASHELAPLDTDMSVPSFHGLLMTGGSALGLFAAEGIVRFLVERKIGVVVPHGVVPIVPAVAIYDLHYKKPVAPASDAAYQAAIEAKENNKLSGQIGAGTGATVGKIIPDARRMHGGMGVAEMTLPGGISVLAYAVVNPVGDVRNEKGEIVAGAVTKEGRFADCEKVLLSGVVEPRILRRSNTTLVAVFTNVNFSKGELKRISKMAIAGLARTISPVFTDYDGDIVFSISLGDLVSSVLTIGTVAAEVVRLAILDAVKKTEIVS